MSKQNCWEFKKCGREPHGCNIKELGICPASIERHLDKEHGGKNAGRACWIITGTFCTGEIQGTFAKKYKSCKDCDFYNLVKEEEGIQFKIGTVLMDKLMYNF